jgi:hypothetical protein
MPRATTARTSRTYYFYVDNLPTHSYERYLYKYPQAEYPYDDLVAVNRARSRHEMEYELIDTGVFEGGRYFDVEVEHEPRRGRPALPPGGLRAAAAELHLVGESQGSLRP